MTFFANELLTLFKTLPHITPTLRELYWLPVEESIMFKVLISFKTLHRLSTTHLLKRTLCSSSKSLFIIPTVTSVTYGQRAFSLVYVPIEFQ